MRRSTRDHQEIKTWSEQRGGIPARVAGSDVLRVAFDRVPGNWQRLSWEQFFAIFDRDGLELQYEDSPGSRLCKITRNVQYRPIRLSQR